MLMPAFATKWAAPKMCACRWCRPPPTCLCSSYSLGPCIRWPGGMTPYVGGRVRGEAQCRREVESPQEAGRKQDTARRRPAGGKQGAGRHPPACLPPPALARLRRRMPETRTPCRRPPTAIRCTSIPFAPVSTVLRRGAQTRGRGNRDQALFLCGGCSCPPFGRLRFLVRSSLSGGGPGCHSNE